METLKEIELGSLVLSKTNPRHVTDKVKDQELTESVKSNGVITPIKVRPVNNHFEVILGSRRFAAAKACGLKTIPAVVEKLTDEQAMEQQVIENLQRDDLNPIDEARGFSEMIIKFKWTQKDLCTRVGKSEKYVSNAIRMLHLPEEIKKAINDGTITPGHAAVLLRLEGETDQKKLFRAIISNKLSVRSAENELEFLGVDLEYAPFDKADCKKCSFNGEKQLELLDKETDLKGRCLNKPCFVIKVNAHIQKLKEALEKKGRKVMKLSEFQKQLGIKNDYNETKSKDLENHRREKSFNKIYNDKCRKCDKCISVIVGSATNTNDELIRERCIDPACFDKLNKTKTDDLRNQDMQKREVESAIDNARQEAYQKVIIGKVSTRIKKAIALEAILENISYESGYEKIIPKSINVHYVELRKIYEMGEKKIDELIGALSEKKAELKDDGDMNFIIKTLGLKLEKELVITREYLEVHNTEQLVKIAKEIGLVDFYKNLGTPAEVMKKMAGTPKKELVELFFHKSFDLKGRVPKEMLK